MHKLILPALIALGCAHAAFAQTGPDLLLKPLMSENEVWESNGDALFFNSGSATYADLERIAVLGGSAPRGEGSQGVPSGRWSLHPDGYYIRYIPSSYSSTRVEIWVPQGSPTAGKEYDPATHIAVPGNTSRQRLIQSGRIRQEM